MQRAGVQPRVWALGERLKRGLEKLALDHPALRLKISGQPAAPALAFELGELAAAAKALTIRRMLARGFMVSSQLYVMFVHDETLIDLLLTNLAETFAELTELHSSGRLRAEAGELAAPTGFARLA
jgi:hypothetical protein